MSNLSAHVDRAVRRVEQFDEDPRMAVVVATDGSGLSMDQREAVLEQTRQQTATVVADGSGHDTDIEDIGEPRDDNRCPACGAEGDLEKTLAPGQRRCPTPVDQCAVITFLEGPRDV
ncbi:hypothetical protein [Haloarcula pellucida]|uniref:Uncharacterized protein n=1 Tax=Haloarcula pellucida TaxID=1427151 RepID=A0A830GRV6_9EURY|nr:hypothetical protein [Halomicroarcula pellucida]MBX0350505.1 hypothetical protein [Halomicroarcula pellucida]GGO03636.1 hypothetical protein GCM10009030_39510 [Halomicroarcula pellucida]